jgi:hypothetical protein
VFPYIRCKTPFQGQSVFCLLDWILHYALFHGFDTLGSHLREEGSLDYDGGLVRLQVQTKFDTNIYRQQEVHKDMPLPLDHLNLWMSKY